MTVRIISTASNHHFGPYAGREGFSRTCAACMSSVVQLRRDRSCASSSARCAFAARSAATAGCSSASCTESQRTPSADTAHARTRLSTASRHEAIERARRAASAAIYRNACVRSREARLSRARPPHVPAAHAASAQCSLPAPVRVCAARVCGSSTRTTRACASSACTATAAARASTSARSCSAHSRRSASCAVRVCSASRIIRSSAACSRVPCTTRWCKRSRAHALTHSQARALASMRRRARARDCKEGPVPNNRTRRRAERPARAGSGFARRPAGAPSCRRPRRQSRRSAAAQPNVPVVAMRDGIGEAERISAICFVASCTAEGMVQVRVASYACRVQLCLRRPSRCTECSAVRAGRCHACSPSAECAAVSASSSAFASASAAACSSAMLQRASMGETTGNRRQALPC